MVWVGRGQTGVPWRQCRQAGSWWQDGYGTGSLIFGEIQDARPENEWHHSQSSRLRETWLQGPLPAPGCPVDSAGGQAGLLEEPQRGQLSLLRGEWDSGNRRSPQGDWGGGGGMSDPGLQRVLALREVWWAPGAWFCALSAASILESGRASGGAPLREGSLFPGQAATSVAIPSSVPSQGGQ